MSTLPQSYPGDVNYRLIFAEETDSVCLLRLHLTLIGLRSVIRTFLDKHFDYKAGQKRSNEMLWI